jgi:hypothetical protein
MENVWPAAPSERATPKEVFVFVRRMYLPNPHDPFQDPSWRWKRTGYLLDQGQQPLWKLDDDCTREAWLFRQALEHCRTDANREQLASDYRGFAEAHGVYTGESLKRWELEARLLAGQSDEAIAARCDLSTAAVVAYHSAFYEVRPHLHADSYVVTVLIGPKAHYGPTTNDHEPLLKLAGYGLGGHGVDALLDYLQNPPAVPAWLDCLDLAALKNLCNRLRTKILVLLLTTPTSAARPATWQRLAEQFAAARRELKGGNGQEAVLASTEVLLDVLATLSVGEPLKTPIAEAVA